MISPTDAYQFKPKEILLLKFGIPAIAMLIKLWGLSCRLVFHKVDALESHLIRKHNGCVYATWHQRMFYLFHYFGRHKLTVMISRSKDGEYAATVARWLGIESVRGSQNRGGLAALKELIRMLKKGFYKIGMLVDGSTGPPRVLKMGTVKIARETGRPVIPVMYGAKRKIVFNSWDRYFIPLPFTEVVVLHGKPHFVPPNADRNTCEAIRQNIEKEMNRLADLCDYWWDGRPVGKPGVDLPAETISAG